MPISGYRFNTKMRLTMLCLSGFELYSRYGAPDVSQVAGERVEYIKKAYIVGEEIKEVELRTRRAQFIYDRN